jgi:iron complex outermembrane receptor protein
MVTGTLLLPSAAAWGADKPPAQIPEDLTEASLEELMQIEVTSVSRKEQVLSHAPAAIYVITQEDIRRSGLTSIPEVLRLAPGVEVARVNAHEWAISARGFNGRVANKLLVLIDGRSVYTPMYSGVYWDAQDLPLEDIDRIEVIRGPGATMWGANAVNGVINIITKSARETQGGLITAGGGNDALASGSLQYGGKLGSNAYYRAYSRSLWRGSSLLPDGRSAPDGWNMSEGGFRVDWDHSDRNSWTFQGDGYRSHLGPSTNYSVATLQPPYSTENTSSVEPDGGNFLARWKHRISDRSDTELQFYADAYSRNGESLVDRRLTFDLDFQQRFEVSDRQELLWGLEARSSNDSTTGTFYSSVTPAAYSESLFSGFLQDEFRLIPDRLFVTAGVKIERNDFTGFEIQPDLRLMWIPTPRQGVWAAVSRAVRTPSRLDQGILVHGAVFPGQQGILDVVTYFGTESFQSENVLAYQAGYRVQGRRLSLDATGFYNLYHQLQTDEPGMPYTVQTPVPYLVIPYYYANKMHGEGRGTEISAMYKPVNAWRLNLSYSRLDLDLHLEKSSQDLETRTHNSDPEHQWQVHSYLDLTRHLQWDAGLYYVGAIAYQGVPAYARLDTRLGWRPGAGIEFSISGQNLLDSRHMEFFNVLDGAIHGFEVGRSVFGKVIWRF